MAGSGPGGGMGPWGQTTDVHAASDQRAEMTARRKDGTVSGLPGLPGWEMWAVTEYGTFCQTWHGRPVGAPSAVAHGDSTDSLARAARDWLNRPLAEIDARVAALRLRLDGTPETYAYERTYIAALIETELVAARYVSSEK